MGIPEIKIRVSFRGKKSTLYSVSNAQETADILRLLMSKDGLIHYREEMVMLCLNHAHKVIGYYRVSAGGQTGTVADTRIIATLALNTTATSVILGHNHPSGNVRPSSADIVLTKKVKEGLALLDIKLLDHLIVTDESYYSLADEGYMD